MSVNATFTGMVERNLNFFLDITNQLDERGYDALDSYRDNLYRAINFGGQTAAHNLTAALLILRCTQYIEQRCNYRHWAKLLTRVANRYEADDPVTFAKLLSMTGYFRFQAGQLDRAERAYRSSERVALRSEDNLAVATAWYYLGTMYYQRAEFDSAKSLIEQTLTIVRALDSSQESLRLLGYALNLMALIQMDVGEFSAAEAALLSASEALADNRSEYHYHLIRYNLAKLRIRQKRFAEAEALLQEELAYSSQHDLPTFRAQAITRLTYLYIRQKKWSEALETCLQLDITELQKRGQLIEIAMAKNNLGYIYLHLNQLNRAETYTLEAIKTWELLQHDVEIANCLASLAAVQFAQHEIAACQLSCNLALQHLGRSAQKSIRSAAVREEISELLRLVEEKPVIC